MKPGLFGVLIPLAVVAACGAVIGPARAQGTRQHVFACALGGKTVDVSAIGSQLFYSFGTPAHAELRITASAEHGNVFYRSDIYAGPEQQLRFVVGSYSYTVYSADGDPRKGARAISGLVVTRNGKQLADMSCERYAEFGTGFDYSTLPQDTEDHSAM